MRELVPIGLYGNMTDTYPSFIGERLEIMAKVTLIDAQLGEVDLDDITDILIDDGIPSPQQVLRSIHPEGAYDGTHAIQRCAGAFATVYTVLSEREKFAAYNNHWNMEDLGWFEEGEFRALTDDGHEFSVVTSVLPGAQKLSRIVPDGKPIRHLTDIEDARRRARTVGEEAGYGAA